MSWVSLRPQSKSKYQRDSGEYFVGGCSIEFRPVRWIWYTKRSPDGYVFGKLSLSGIIHSLFHCLQINVVTQTINHYQIKKADQYSELMKREMVEAKTNEISNGESSKNSVTATQFKISSTYYSNNLLPFTLHHKHETTITQHMIIKINENILLKTAVRLSA